MWVSGSVLRGGRSSSRSRGGKSSAKSRALYIDILLTDDPTLCCIWAGSAAGLKSIVLLFEHVHLNYMCRNSSELTVDQHMPRFK